MDADIVKQGGQLQRFLLFWRQTLPPADEAGESPHLHQMLNPGGIPRVVSHGRLLNGRDPPIHPYAALPQWK